MVERLISDTFIWIICPKTATTFLSTIFFKWSYFTKDFDINIQETARPLLNFTFLFWQNKFFNALLKLESPQSHQLNMISHLSISYMPRLLHTDNIRAKILSTIKKNKTVYNHFFWQKKVLNSANTTKTSKRLWPN